MKKLLKIMLSVAAVAVVTAAMAVTVMAEDTITGTYNNGTGEVTMNGVVGSGKSQTLLVLDNNVTEGQDPAIAYINQIDNNGTFSTFMLASGLKPAPGKSATYNIKIGGTNGTVQTGTLTIAGDALSTVTIKIGDVTGDEKANVDDITAIGKYIIGRNKVGAAGAANTGVSRTKADNSTLIIGDVNGDEKANVDDITAIGKYIIGRNKVGAAGAADTGKDVEVLDNTSAE